MDVERYLGPREMAERLGLSPLTVGDRLRAGTLPGFRYGGRWKVLESEFAAYLVASSDEGVANRRITTRKITPRKTKP